MTVVLWGALWLLDMAVCATDQPTFRHGWLLSLDIATVFVIPFVCGFKIARVP